MRTPTTAVLVALISSFGAAGSTAHAKPGPAPAPVKPVVDPDAKAALHKMGEFLRSQQAFGVQARGTTDDVLPSGQKVEYGAAIDLKVRRPDRMRMDISGDRRNDHIYYDGKTFTVYSDKVGYFASFAAPGTLAELKDVLERRYALDLPLADLFYWGTDQDGSSAVQAATHVGVANIDGFQCDHYAFRQKDVDWELWIEQGGRPVPRKFVITTTAEKAKPQHSMVLNWDLTPKLEDHLFTFVAPPNAHQIGFDAVDRRKGGQTP